MFTRKQYLEQARSPKAFRRYYGEIIEAAGGPRAFRLPFSLNAIREALANGDTHLNSLPLTHWDAYAIPVSAKAAAALRDRGDYPTLGNAVCILKEAARLLAEEETTQ